MTKYKKITQDEFDTFLKDVMVINYLHKCDLRNLDFSGKNLQGVEFHSCLIDNSCLLQPEFRSAKIINCELKYLP